MDEALTTARVGKAGWFSCLLLIGLAVIATRISVLSLAMGRVPVGDPAMYLEVARNMLAGRGMAQLGTHGIVYRAYYPPVYPTLLAATGLIAPLGPTTLLALNTIIDVTTAAAIVWFGCMVGSRRTALAAAAAYLLWPTAILMAPVANKEGLATLLVVLMAGLAVEASRRRYVALGLGVVAASAALTQPALALLPLFIALAVRPLYSTWRDWTVAHAMAAVTAAIALTPWWIRNALIFHEFVPLTTASGANFWVGTMPSGAGTNWMPLSPHLLHGNELSVSRAAGSEAIAWVRSAPFDFARHTLAKIPSVLNGDQWWSKPISWMVPIRQPNVVLAALPQVLSILLMGLAGVGAVLMRRTVLTRVALACLANVFLVELWFEFSERHRYFLTPLLLLLAAETIQRAYCAIKEKAHTITPAPATDT